MGDVTPDSTDKGILKEFSDSKRPGCIFPHAWLLVCFYLLGAIIGETLEEILHDSGMLHTQYSLY